jgi:hypothetical protein
VVIVLVPAKEAIQMKKVKFYGGLYLEPNGTLVATKNPDEPPYIGPPSQEIDDAWQALIHGMAYVKIISIQVYMNAKHGPYLDRYLTVTYEEAKQVSENTFYSESRGGYSVG